LFTSFEDDDGGWRRKEKEQKFTTLDKVMAN